MSGSRAGLLLVVIFCVVTIVLFSRWASPAEAHRSSLHYVEPTKEQKIKRCFKKEICTEQSQGEIIYERKSRRKVWTERGGTK